MGFIFHAPCQGRIVLKAQRGLKFPCGPRRAFNIVVGLLTTLCEIIYFALSFVS